MRIALIYVPYPTEQAALDAVNILLESKLIACGNLVSSQSSFIWQGVRTTEDEWIAIIKTSTTNIMKTIDKIKQSHPYQLPAILFWEVNTNDEYAKWVENQVSID